MPEGNRGGKVQDTAPGNFAQGGKQRMFGYSPSLAARGGMTSAR
jgi:hypothetical protein